MSFLPSAWTAAAIDTEEGDNSYILAAAVAAAAVGAVAKAIAIRDGEGEKKRRFSRAPGGIPRPLTGWSVGKAMNAREGEKKVAV